jgi:hypothetical protein
VTRHDDDLHDISPDERAELDQLASRLVRERPVPHPMFRGELRRRLGRGKGRNRLRLQAAAYLAASAVLFSVATLGVFDVGPLAPQPLDQRAAAGHVSASR